MHIKIYEDSQSMGQAAGKEIAAILKSVLKQKGQARMVVATGASQFTTLEQLIEEPGIDWSRVTFFHLDEYIGITDEHPASFCRYIRERLISKLPEVQAIHYINGIANPEDECRRLEILIKESPIDILLAGIGENGHLAFNDPPADFETKHSYRVVNLDEECRRQQLGEGWFSGLDEVPKQAISMSIHQIMQAVTIICSVPDSRKAKAVKNCLEKDISPLYPAGILKSHTNCLLYLDKESAALLSQETITTFQS